MAINATTLVAAIGTTDTSLTVTSATGITAPNFTTGVGITYLMIEMEYMLVTNVVGTVVSVQRGYLGSPTAAHGASVPVIAGLPTDFPAPPIAVKASMDFNDLFGVSAPVASAATITMPGNYMVHLTGTATVTTITPPTGTTQGGPFYVVFDSTAAFATGGNIGVAVTGAAGKMVVVCYDAGNTKWYSTT